LLENQLRICFGEAARQGLLAVNPAVRVKLLKSTAESKRRAFTLNEIKRILRACGNDAEWRRIAPFCSQNLSDRRTNRKNSSADNLRKRGWSLG